MMSLMVGRVILGSFLGTPSGLFLVIVVLGFVLVFNVIWCSDEVCESGVHVGEDNEVVFELKGVKNVRTGLLGMRVRSISVFLVSLS